MKIIIKESQYNLLIEKFDFDKNNFISVEHLISDEGKFKDILSDNSVSSEYKSAIKALLQSYRDLVFQSPEETKKINVYDLITTAHQLNNKLDAFEKFLHHPMYMCISLTIQSTYHYGNLEIMEMKMTTRTDHFGDGHHYVV